MNLWFLTISFLRPLVRDVTALDRWQGLDDSFPTVETNMGKVWLVVMLIVVLLASSVLVTLAYGHLRRRRLKADMERRALQAGLGAEELKILRLMVGLAGLKNPVEICDVPSAFDTGVTRLMQSGKVAGMSDALRMGLGLTLGAMREKLGLPVAPSVAESGVLSSSRQIPEGDKVFVSVEGSAYPIEAVVLRNGPVEFTVEPEESLEAEIGHFWLVRYSCGSSAWEFESPVFRSVDGRAALGHSQEIRSINRRRFQRVNTDRPARLATFAFHGDRETPRFTSATLVQIAGPGLVLRSPVKAKQGQKVLVSLELDDDRQVQGLGRVRRTFRDEQGKAMIAVELVGLDSNELAEMVQETNLTAIRPEPKKARAARVKV